MITQIIYVATGDEEGIVLRSSSAARPLLFRRPADQHIRAGENEDTAAEALADQLGRHLGLPVTEMELNPYQVLGAEWDWDGVARWVLDCCQAPEPEEPVPFGAVFPDPDHVGQSEYRAILDVVLTGALNMDIYDLGADDMDVDWALVRSILAECARWAQEFLVQLDQRGLR
ncbi:MAG: hypothetical protein KKA73_29540 [Chloroflexi bacterium]|nr:hypothetical protein [Chloroflexota bacterium]MBU1751841.1 hypothetical protein [Chloroflexota bacterium]